MEAALLFRFRALLGDLGALGNRGALGAALLWLGIHGCGTESQGGSDHQHRQFLHLAVLLWIATIYGRLG